MNKKMGRPPLPKGKARSVQVGVRFTPEDDKAIEKALTKSGQTKADLVRDAAVAEARKPPPWVRSKWTYEDLNGKKVQFKLNSPRFQAKGVGEFLVRRNPRGELAIEICAIVSATPYEVTEHRYWLGQEIANKIEINSTPNVAPFRLLM